MPTTAPVGEPLALCCAGVTCTCADCPSPSFRSTMLTGGSAAPLALGYAALADPVRLRLVSLLATAPDSSVCVCDLIIPLGKSQSTVSHHLKFLGDAGLVTGTKQGRQVFYRLDQERLDLLRNAMAKEHTHE